MAPPPELCNNIIFINYLDSSILIVGWPGSTFSTVPEASSISSTAGLIMFPVSATTVVLG